MCDLNCDNLIDLSLDDEASCNNLQSQAEFHAQLSTNFQQFVSPSCRNRDSLENNPFDSVQKLANRLNDPFNVAESEAHLKAQKVCIETAKIKLGNLLSLSEDNLLKTSTARLNDNIDILKPQELDLESPPVALNEKHPTDSVSGTDTTPNSSAEISTSAKMKKNMEHRKVLLKLSISNSTFSSPAIHKELNELYDILETPVSSIFSKTAQFEENLLSAESPLKFVEDEDKLSEDQLPTSIDSEKKFEADLEMLKIPILNELPSPVIEHTPIKSDESGESNIESPVLENSLPNLEAIKAKLKAKKSEISYNNRHEISNLIENLKALISSGEMLDERKKQAGSLLESLSSALIPSKIETANQNSEMLDVPPHSITRQGTFDLDIQEKYEPNADKAHQLQDIPKCMISSSATYDGETPMEKQDFDLPEIAPLSPQSLPSPSSDQNTQININEIVEQLSKLLINNSDDQTNTNNPTLIVVMNTNQINNSNISYKHNAAKARSGVVANYLENAVNDDSPDLIKVDSLPRRRAQSLSIHDKIKVVHLPLHPPTLRTTQKEDKIEMNEISPIKKSPPSNDKGTPDSKTPVRLRRNSYSSGTPYTAQIGLRKTGVSTETKKFSQMRKAQTLDTHHEDQQHAIIRPLSNNLTFKPDLKKKVKPKIESIMKSSGPLKATIPVKKVAPMLKASSPSPEKKVKSKISGTPSTPIPSRGSKLVVEVGYPNACSTPSAFAPPLKRTTDPVNKPRYSYISTTPNLTNSSTGSLKRRTITELKAKSPMKPHNNSGLQIPSSSRPSTGSSRLSISAGGKISKTISKAVTNTAVVKPILEPSRLSSRLSIGGSLLSNRNKENKHI